MLTSRRLKRKVEGHRREMAEAFAAWLSETHQESPRPGFYVMEGEGGWRHLEGESPTSQDRRFDTMTDDTVLSLGIRVELVCDGALAVSSNIVVIP
jgi:hypothetical protein